MDASIESQSRLLDKKALLHPIIPHTNHARQVPTSFVLRTEAEMEKSIAEELNDTQIPTASFTEDEDNASASIASTAYGVQSLEDAMLVSDDSLSTSPRLTHHEPIASSSVLAGWKRKPGNPVHPKIYATGQRIVSSELHLSPALSATINSPSRAHPRRSSMSSSMHLTPPSISPNVEAATPGTPRTNSLKSFKLSDEEASVASDTGSQAILSSSSDGEQELQLPPSSVLSGTQRESELVMPSIAMPSRRPFTQRGRNMGQLKLMVAGRKGLGKSSLIRSVFRTCEDIVHVDGISNGSSVQSTTGSKTSGFSTTSQMSEFQASTKPYPVWWSDMENSRAWWRRKSMGEAILERNLCFVDTPGVDGDASVQALLKEVDMWYGKLAHADTLPDAQLLSLLTGRSDSFLDVVLYLFDSNIDTIPDDELRLLHELSKRSNLIPLLAKCDESEPEQTTAAREHLWTLLTAAKVEFCSLSGISSSETRSHLNTSSQDIFAVSSLIDDGDIMDASTLMASDYLPPLANSDLHILITALFDPSSIAQLRHQSILKFLSWRREHFSRSRPVTGGLYPPRGQGLINTGSLIDEPSKILVPHAYSSYYRSTSPSASDSSDLIFGATPAGITRPDQELLAAEPTRHIHIAKWARDLRRSLRMDGGRHGEISLRPAKGRLGGELGIIDPKDPLGILSVSQAFGSNGWLALQVIGGCGLVSAAVWWLSRNWLELQEWMWPSQSYLSPTAIPAPSARSWMGSFRIL